MVRLCKEFSRFWDSMTIVERGAKPFSQTWRTASSNMDGFLRPVVRSSPGYGYKAYYSKRDFPGWQTGIFNETSVNGMLELSDYEALDMVALFI